jgi:hypothetical protein
MTILNGVGRSAIDPCDLSTFDGPPKHKPIQGPARLYRFGKPSGRWWFDSSLMNTLKEDFYESEYGDGPRQKDEDITRYLRDVLGVSLEWNKFAWVSILTLKDGEGLDVFVGLTAAQPEWQNKKDGPMLNGGSPQYVIYEIGKVPSRNFTDMPTTSLWQKWA